MRLSLLKACNGILPHFERKYQVSILHIDFSENEQKARLSGLFTDEELRGMVEGSSYCVVDPVLPFAAASTDERLGSVERCNLTRMSVLYKKMVKNCFATR